MKVHNEMTQGAMIREDYASYITIAKSGSEEEDSDQIRVVGGAIHAICLLLKTLSRVMRLPLPYPLQMSKKKGFKV